MELVVEITISSLYLAHEVIWLADEHDFVGLVVAETEALVGVAPRQVAVGVARNEDLVLLDGVNHPVAMLDLTDGTFQLLVKGRQKNSSTSE